MTRASLAALALSVLVTAAAYGGGIDNGFHFDDGHSIEDNVYVQSFEHLSAWFTDVRSFSPLAQNRSYRPILLVTYAISNALGGGTARGYHLLTLLFHALGAFVVGLLVRRFLRAAGALEPTTTLGALFAAALFAAHPLGSEAVNYISARSSLLASVLMFASLHAYVVAREDKRRAWYALAGLWLALALGTKLIAITVPALYLGWELTLGPDKRNLRQSGPRTWLLRLGLPALGCLAFTILHERLIGEAVNARSNVPPYSFFLTETRVWQRFIALFLYPEDLCADLTMRWSQSPFEGETFRAIALAIILFASALYFLHRAPLYTFGVFWFFVTLAPTNSIVPLAEPASEHRVYVALPGLILALVAWVPRITRFWPAIAAPIVLVAIWGAKTRSEIWATERALWQSVTTCAPDNGRAFLNYGRALFVEGDRAGARAAYDKCKALWPSWPYCSINQAVLALTEERLADAELSIAEAERLDPDNVYTLTWRGEVDLKATRWAGAETSFRRALDVAPGLAHAEEGLALALFNQGRLADAKALFDKRVGGSAEGWYARGYLADLGGDLVTAEVSYDRALALRATDTRARYNRAVLYQKSGRTKDAIREYELIVDHGAATDDALFNLALALLADGRVDEAKQRREQLIQLRPDYPALAELKIP